MTTTYKILGQSNPAVATATSLYTVPGDAATVLSTLSICNQAATGATYRIAVRPAGATLAAVHYLAYDAAIAANDTVALTLGITLAGTDTLVVQASTSTVSFVAFGAEITDTPAADWTRPADWLVLPTLTTGEQKIVGLYAVYPGDSNQVALQCAGAYTVDWGDGGAPENFASLVAASHNTTFASVPSGTLTSGGYRQAVVTITPQAGQQLTRVDLGQLPAGVASGYVSQWLDVALVGASVADLRISGTTALAAMLEQFAYIGPSALTTVSGLSATFFQNCYALRSVVGTAWTAGMTTFVQMFQNCRSLSTIPLLSTGAGATFNNMFNGCAALTTIPLINTGAATNFSNMFTGCAALKTVPLLNTSAGTNFNQMFINCYSLQTIPLLNTAAGTNFANMFNACVSLQAVPSLNVAVGTSYGGIFGGCKSLKVGALTGTSQAIDYSSCKLSGPELDAIYTGLATVVGQTITVTGNPGVAADTPSIATDKGWTVTGS